VDCRASAGSLARSRKLAQRRVVVQADGRAPRTFTDRPKLRTLPRRPSDSGEGGGENTPNPFLLEGALFFVARRGGDGGRRSGRKLNITP